MESKLDRYDILLIVSSLIFVGDFILVRLNYSLPPSEDAAILIRYSQHLADGHGIVWNVGEGHVDGATDFLFMILLAALARAGYSLVAAARMVGFVSHLITVGLVYFGVRTLNGSGRLAAFVSAMYLGMGPAIGYIQACFGTPFFALFAGITWCFAIAMRGGARSRDVRLMFAFSGVVTALIRPEGAFLAVFMLIAVSFAENLQDSRQALSDFLMVFVLFGGAYFFWRWHYFGFPFPNPFYVKGGGHFYWSSLRSSIWNLMVLSGAFAVPYVLGAIRPGTRRQAAFDLIPILGFTALWVLLSDAMNFMMRFQYAVLPVVLISWPPLVRGLELPQFIKLRKLDLRTRTLLKVSAGALLALLLSYRGEAWLNPKQVPDLNYDVGLVLERYAASGYTLATTEAGLLPLYSNWRTLDAWGLNDPWIAHHGSITEQYLRRHKPDVIEFHAPFSPGVAMAPNPDWPSPETWYSMVLTLKTYAEKNGYCLAAVYGSDPHDTYYYFVRPGLPDSKEIIEGVRDLELTWRNVGWQFFDYREAPPVPAIRPANRPNSHKPNW